MANNNFGQTFAPDGQCVRIDFADDSTDASVAMAPASAVQILSSANIVVSFGIADGDVDAIFPATGNSTGQGCVVASNWQTVLAVPQQVYNTTGTMYVSVASDGTGYAIISTGTLV